MGWGWSLLTRQSSRVERWVASHADLSVEGLSRGGALLDVEGAALPARVGAQSPSSSSSDSACASPSPPAASAALRRAPSLEELGRCTSPRGAPPAEPPAKAAPAALAALA